MKPPVSNPELKPRFFWFRLKPEQINWVLFRFQASSLFQNGQRYYIYENFRDFIFNVNEKNLPSSQCSGVSITFFGSSGN